MLNAVCENAYLSMPHVNFTVIKGRTEFLYVFQRSIKKQAISEMLQPN